MIIRVKVFPDSKKQEIIKKSDNFFEIKVRAKPQRGMANKEVFDILSFYFRVSKSQIRLIRGFRSPAKIFEIKN